MGPRAKITNPGGRPKGVPNKVNGQARAIIAEIVDLKAEQVSVWLEQIEKRDGPLAAFKCWESLVEYAIPKLRSVDMVVEQKKPEHGLTDDELASAIDHFRMLKRKAPITVDAVPVKVTT